MEAFGKLYMTTRDGRVLGIDSANCDQDWESEKSVNMYHELCPTSPLVVSSLGPVTFLKNITNMESPVSVPKLFMADMLIDQNPDGTLASYLPYRHPSHIHECIEQVTRATKAMKTVDRNPIMTGFFRMIRRGFFLGDQDGVRYYPFPSVSELEEEHHLWWRSASLS